ncbi:NYN domain-containing protein [Deinococcus radiophilus]|uniref:NYN domain-containing protein n=1 Tax=Deinococcus radiophilus TaxID=32062 RepID=A0A431W5J7_9DEIO|nr:NYN domain-containing protein [Deinococcus radiophilus]RTR30691.1 NYN domain-containing protein [Deinococcus radiophilus]UFA51243.1 NYN domain-containing protein [Deinococcus radiophilus]
MQFITPKPRVGIFIDTQNLYHSARDLLERTVNFETLLHTGADGRELVHAIAYTVEREGEATARPFIYKLSTLGFKVRRMNLTMHYVGDSGRPIYEGNWDMGMVADMVRLMDHLDIVVLGSGDGDFTDMVEVLQERGKRVEVLAFREHTAQKLIDAADRFIHLPDLPEALMPARRTKTDADTPESPEAE